MEGSVKKELTVLQSSNLHLHCTSRTALVFTVISKPFSAKHQYLPEWILLALKLSVSPLATVFPSFIHVMFGSGFPVAAQWKITCSLSMMVLLDGLADKLGGTIDITSNKL